MKSFTNMCGVCDGSRGGLCVPGGSDGGVVDRSHQFSGSYQLNLYQV